ncbi:MAG: hypothetical protein ACXVH1_32860, partial [Solirubrobacteraceae bacterium]
MPLIDLSSPVVFSPELVLDEATMQGLDKPAKPKEEAPGKDKGVAEPAVTADPIAILIAYAVVGLGIAAGVGLLKWRNPGTFTPGDGISVFAPLYILAQGIERFIEPFSSYLGSASPDKGKDATTAAATGRKKKPQALLLLNQAIVDKEAQTAAVWSRVVDRIRRNTAVIAWGLASFLGIAFCGLFGLF